MFTGRNLEYGLKWLTGVTVSMGIIGLFTVFFLYLNHLRKLKYGGSGFPNFEQYWRKREARQKRRNLERYGHPTKSIYSGVKKIFEKKNVAAKTIDTISNMHGSALKNTDESQVKFQENQENVEK